MKKICRPIMLAVLMSLWGCERSSDRTPAEAAVKKAAARGARHVSAKDWQTEVLNSAEPVLVDFWAEWCAPCREMGPVIDAIAKDEKVVKVDIDKDEELAAKYDVSAIPAFLIFQNGKVAFRTEGVTPEAELRGEIEKLKTAGAQ